MRNSNTLRPAFLYTLVMVLGFSGCDQLVNDLTSDCGPHHTYSNTTHSKIKLMGSDLDGEYRTLVFEDLETPDSICPEKHVKATYQLFWNGNQVLDTSQFTVTGKAYWSGFYERKTRLTPQFAGGGTFFGYKGEEEIGLKAAFPGQPGWLGLQILVKFKSKGDHSTDSAFFYDNLSNLGFGLDYYKYKVPSTK